MPALTTNFSFNKPLVNDPIDEDIWGGQLNDNWDSVDAILPVPAASKFGAVVVQSTNDTGYEIISGQGTTGQFLTSQGADALPIFQSSLGILLETQTASSATEIDFTSNIDSSFRKYEFELINVVPASDALLHMLVSTDGGTSFLTSNYSYHTDTTTIASDSYRASNSVSDSKMVLSTTIESTSSEGYSARIALYDPSQSTVDKVIKSFGGHLESSADLVNANMVGKRNGTTAAIDAIRFIMSTGNIASGTFKLYGIT